MASLVTWSWAPIRCFISATWLTRPITRPPSRRPFQCIHDLFQRLLVQAAEALVHEERFDVHAAGFVLDDIGQAQRQRERGHEGFAAGERGRVAPLPGPFVHDVQAQPGLRVAADLASVC